MLTPTQARAAATNTSRTKIRTASIVLPPSSSIAYVRRAGSDGKRRRRFVTPNDEFAATALLDRTAANAKLAVMLQHNSAPRPHRAHLAHAAVMGMHAICCGLPALAMIAAAASGATSGVTLLSGSIAEFHGFLHAHELWILVLSATFVAVGGYLELSARRGAHRHGFPWLFAFSALCFVANVAIIAVHRA